MAATRVGVMRRIIVVAAVCAFALAATPAAAIVGGKPAQPGQFSYVANISIAGSFGCTGSLIAPRWVLTAGHCGSLTGALSQGLLPTPIAWPPPFYGVQLGSVRADGQGAERHSVIEVRVDSDYLLTNGTGNDVTLLELDAPSQIAPVKIAAVGERRIWEPGALATIAGFGTTAENASGPPSQMQVAQVPITTDDYCASAYPSGLSTIADDGSFDPQTMLCAGYPQGGTDTCQGDSGGPLLTPAANGELRLVAATSFGAGCAQAGKPGVYARLAEGPIRRFIAGVAPDAFVPEPGATAPPSGTTPRLKPKPKRHRTVKGHTRRHRPRRR